MNALQPKVSDVLDDLLLFDWSHRTRPTWPPDAFAVAASLLKRSGAYTEIVNAWPPAGFATIPKWHEFIITVANNWRRRCTNGQWPNELQAWWSTILASGKLHIEDIAEKRELVVALASIIAAADEACAGVGIVSSADVSLTRFEATAFAHLQKHSLCKSINDAYVKVLPKLHNPLSGMTLRSLTHNLALWDKPEVAVEWRFLDLPTAEAGLNLLLLPWPLKIEPKAFKPSRVKSRVKMPGEFGFFTYEMSPDAIDIDSVIRTLEAAEEIVEAVDAVVFPELSMTRRDFVRLRRRLGERLLIAGVGAPESATTFGRNEVAIGGGPIGATRDNLFQQKHHRWLIDASQIKQYGLGPELGGRKAWWEAIDISPRSCTFVCANEWLTFCVLICEDLARQDPVAELVRTVGPNLVVALLMDGPQLPQRWSARYATVLAEDPRSSVLAFTSAGLVDLSRSQAGGGSRNIGLWKDAVSGAASKLVLEQGAAGIVISLVSEATKEWTADGRHDDGATEYLRLTGYHQVRDPGSSG